MALLALPKAKPATGEPTIQPTSATSASTLDFAGSTTPVGAGHSQSETSITPAEKKAPSPLQTKPARILKRSNRFGNAIEETICGVQLTTSDRRRTSCHRCGNQRKSNVICDKCPMIFCRRCADKVIEALGPSAFVGGCVHCKRQCCCADKKSTECRRPVHCLKHCKAKNRAKLLGPAPPSASFGAVGQPMPPSRTGTLSYLLGDIGSAKKLTFSEYVSRRSTLADAVKALSGGSSATTVGDTAARAAIAATKAAAAATVSAASHAVQQAAVSAARKRDAIEHDVEEESESRAAKRVCISSSQ